MKNLRTLIMCLATVTMLTGCELHLGRGGGGHSPTGPTVSTEYVVTPDASYVEVEVGSSSGYYDDYYYDDVCWEDPYWHAEEWCDYYDDGSLCCVWYDDGWYEEWCQWDYDYCWEYNGSF
jgi:hypothetical protein